MKNCLEIIRINQYSITPKYRQLANAIVSGIKSGMIAQDEILPSIHKCCVALDISKNSVEKAYKALKSQGIVGSVKGKGYYVATCSDKIEV